ncbi:hypothetical protein V0U79_08620 [Hyphobacterium sp. HN65]|uniref:Secreted protein n=1 Tax=Hyphobacterium lacteum TaxID=3116575 RepID=A0ABU7LR89_9PROT|nr:hypothetical protein [Hyphobacterium sp. HN65]MEE2526428.1 hypothetical protein [Hyphobacterium sp. HN65]
MKNLVLTTAALALLASGSAFADGLDNAVGNTVRIMIGDTGQGFDAYFDADGTFSDSLGRSGGWEYGTELCVIPPAETEAPPACGPWNEDLAPGGEWQTDAWAENGTMLTFTILEGRGHDAPTPPTPPAE